MDAIAHTFLKVRDANETNTDSAGYDECLSVTPNCPVEATIYGYYPNLGANVFFAIIFGICLIAQTFFSIKHRTWTYLVALFFGCLGEVVGYAGRVILNDNPWDETGFQMQICCLIIAPAFIAAAVYITLKHIVIELGPQYSHLPPMWYTRIFILCDFLSLVLQGAGGGIAATADNGSNGQDIGNDLMMAGIVWQVITLLIFGGLCADYARRLLAHRNQLPASAYTLLHTTRFRGFVAAVSIAYITIFARCVYRIAEMANGWKSEIMQEENGFIIMEGAMIAIAVLALTIFHPGWAFPEMQIHKAKDGRSKGEKDVELSDSSPQ